MVGNEGYAGIDKDTTTGQYRLRRTLNIEAPTNAGRTVHSHERSDGESVVITPKIR